MYNKNQEELIKVIENIIKNNDYRTYKETVGKTLRERNLNSSIVILSSEIIMGNAKIEQLINNEDNDIRYLFFFADALNKALKTSDDQKDIIILENYFLKTEFEELKDYVEKKKNESIFPIVITEVNQINEHHWEGVIDGKYMHLINSYKLPIYNPNTQRNPKRTKKGDKINIDPKKIIEIKNDLLEKEYETDEIIWNILKTGDEKFNYNSKNRTLTIYDGSILNIIDGMHRKEANSAAINENPDFNCRWPLSIFNVSEYKAHKIMSQKNKQTKMPDEWTDTKDYNKKENDVISKIIDERSSLIKIMGEDDKQITLNQALVKKSNIALAIKEIYKDDIKDSDDRRQLAKWLSEFFDYMIKLYSYDFKENPSEVKEVSFINWKNMFYGYIALSKSLWYKDNWRDLFKQKMQSLDFSKTNLKWQNIGMLNIKDANTTLRKNLYSIFQEGVE
jgi:hypothetical protein